MSSTLSRRIDEYYAPVTAWCRRRIDESDRRPVFIGINGPQGSGKSTLAAHIVRALADDHVRAITISIDDFYLTRAEQLSLAARFEGNRALEHRGYPGTHDVALGLRTLSSLQRGETVRLPRYDKSAHDGRGDRAPESSWPTLTPPIDLVIVEGWMLGFRPVDDTSLEPDLRAPNQMLAEYDAWDSLLDAFVILDAGQLDDIVRWRIDAERARRERGEPALSDDDARDYVERFLPAYRAYLPGLRSRSIGRRGLVAHLGPDRHPTSIEER